MEEGALRRKEGAAQVHSMISPSLIRSAAAAAACPTKHTQQAAKTLAWTAPAACSGARQVLTVLNRGFASDGERAVQVED